MTNAISQYPPILPHFPAHPHIQHIKHHQNTSAWDGGVGLTCEEEEGRRQKEMGEGRSGREGGKEGGREGGKEGRREGGREGRREGMREGGN